LLQIINGLVGEKHKNLVNIATLFYALKHGMPMLEYDIHKNLFDFLNFEENPKMHCINDYGWAMVQHMHVIILEATKFVIGITCYLSFTCNEVNIIHACGSKLIASTNPFVSRMYGG